MNKLKITSSVTALLFLAGTASSAFAMHSYYSMPYMNMHMNRPYYRVSSVNYSTRSYVSIRNFQFNPMYLVVREGSSVVWTNYDNVAHTTTSDYQYGNNGWNSGRLSPGDSFVQYFNRPGTYYYHCNIHPDMRGTIIVVPRNYTY